MDIRALSFKNNILVPEISDTSIALTGQAKLVQRIIKCLLTIPGSDKFDPDFGAGIQKALPSLYDNKNIEKVKMAAIESILITEKQIKAEDASADYPLNEKLGYLSLRDLQFNPSESQWVLSLNLRDGNNVNVNINVGLA